MAVLGAGSHCIYMVVVVVVIVVLVADHGGGDCAGDATCNRNFVEQWLVK